LQALQRQLKAFSAEVQAHSARPQQLRALADQLAKDRYDQMSEVSARVAQIDGEYEEITQALEGRRQKLDEAFALQVMRWGNATLREARHQG
jgi:citrate synthase